ncbi:MAG TPA: hypothetical protein VJ499_05355 [Flavisolibacter sp.]|nr:hypothetical protein [Flavisolibacter sp.]
MAEPTLNIEQDFLVKDSKITNYIIGGALLAVFVVSMSYGDYGWSNYLIAICMFLIPGAVAIAKGQQNTIIIRINKTGFFYAGKLITEWKLFYDATVQDKMATGSYRDNFVLALRYYSADHSLIYTQNIPLTNTQDRSEEEIIEAINFFCHGGKTVLPDQPISQVTG